MDDKLEAVFFPEISHFYLILSILFSSANTEAQFISPDTYTAVSVSMSECTHWQVLSCLWC